MSSSPEPRTITSSEDKSPPPAATRRADVEAKQTRVAALLAECDCEALLLLEPANVAWATGGVNAWSFADAEQAPAVFCTADYRWLVAGNLDAQRLFDEELDGLGFQLKEWAWYDGREQMLAYLVRNKRMACDRPFESARVVGDRLRELRATLSAYEQTAYRQLGATVSHALEAAGRTLSAGQTEQEIAGQLAHRLLHRGVEVAALQVAADGRGRRYRRSTPGAAVVQRGCVLTLTGRQAGLHATASRSVCFGPPDPGFQREHSAACKITASYVASSWSDAVPGAILQAARRVYKSNLVEHEWRHCPGGYLTGRSAVERVWTVDSQDLLHAGSAVTWMAGIGAAMSCDTFLITAKGPLLVTRTVNWPYKRIRIQGANLDRPDILQR